ncbi:MAG TPA: YceI family protein [Gammaproteobacteria bacterium]|nr:YceI family protein [Gammaproteobacteria bacterium]
MKRILLALALLAVSLPSAAAWQLDNQRSSLYFVSIKKNDVAEINHFSHLAGEYHKGRAKLSIDLSSVETGIDIRDKRVRQHLFEVNRFATANVTMEVPEQRVAELTAGNSLTLDAHATLSLHGTEKKLPTTLEVTRLADGSLMVANFRPVIVNAGDFDLAQGVKRLREIAGLPSISPAVPVQFTLFFTKE